MTKEIERVRQRKEWKKLDYKLFRKTGGKITGMIHMPARAQKILSKPYNVKVAKRVRAEIVADTSLGAHTEKAATGGWVGSGSSRGHSHEYDRDCC